MTALRESVTKYNQSSEPNEPCLLMKLVSLRGSVLTDVVKHVPYFLIWLAAFLFKKEKRKKASDNKNMLIECRVANIHSFSFTCL